MTTYCVPAGRAARLLKAYAPATSVAVVVVAAVPSDRVTGAPSVRLIVKVTDGMPNSPASWMPSRSVSDQTKSPTDTLGAAAKRTRPKSTCGKVPSSGTTAVPELVVAVPSVLTTWYA